MKIYVFDAEIKHVSLFYEEGGANVQVYVVPPSDSAHRHTVEMLFYQASGEPERVGACLNILLPVFEEAKGEEL